MVVVAGLTPTEVPVPTNAPPQLPEYQFHVAPVPKDPPVREIVVAPLGQVGLTVADALAAAAEFEFTVTVTLTQDVLLHKPSALT